MSTPTVPKNALVKKVNLAVIQITPVVLTQSAGCRMVCMAVTVIMVMRVTVKVVLSNTPTATMCTKMATPKMVSIPFVHLAGPVSLFLYSVI